MKKYSSIQTMDREVKDGLIKKINFVTLSDLIIPDLEYIPNINQVKVEWRDNKGMKQLSYMSLKQAAFFKGKGVFLIKKDRRYEVDLHIIPTKMPTVRNIRILKNAF